MWTNQALPVHAGTLQRSFCFVRFIKSFENVEASLLVFWPMVSFVQRRFRKKAAARSTSPSSGKSHETFFLTWPWLKHEPILSTVYSQLDLQTPSNLHGICYFITLNRTHLAELRSHNSWMSLKFSKNVNAQIVHPLHWQRLLQDCLDPKTNFMDGHLLHQLLCFPVLFFQGFQLKQQAAQAKLDRRILMCISWIRHPTLLEGGNVTRLPTAAAIVSTGRHSSHEFRSAQMDPQLLQLGSVT